MSYLIARGLMMEQGKGTVGRNECQSFTLRLPEELISRIYQIVERDAYATRVNVILQAIYEFLKQIYSECTEIGRNNRGNKDAYNNDLRILSKQYKDKYDSLLTTFSDGGGDTVSISFSMPIALLERINDFNSGSLRYRNAQEFVRIAIAWFLDKDYMLHWREVDVRDLWREDHVFSVAFDMPFE